MKEKRHRGGEENNHAQRDFEPHHGHSLTSNCMSRLDSLGRHRVLVLEEDRAYINRS